MRISDWSSDVCSSDLANRLAGGGDDALDHRVGLGVHRRSIQRLVAVGDAQEAGALLEGLLAKPRHFQQVAAAPDRAVGVAVHDDVAGHRRRQPGHPRSEEHTSELQSLMRISYAVFCLNKKKDTIATL